MTSGNNIKANYRIKVKVQLPETTYSGPGKTGS